MIVAIEKQNILRATVIVNRVATVVSSLRFVRVQLTRSDKLTLKSKNIIYYSNLIIKAIKLVGVFCFRNNEIFEKKEIRLITVPPTHSTN